MRSPRCDGRLATVPCDGRELPAGVVAVNRYDRRCAYPANRA
jgi:hypothetical protein